MKNYRVHTGLQVGPEGEFLPPEEWQEVTAADEHDAVYKILRRNSKARPAVVFVARQKPEHKNGMPMIVDRYSLQWGV